MIIELEFSAAKFTSIFRERVKQELVKLLCPAQKELMVLEAWVLDRVELGPTEVLPNSTAQEEARVSQQLQWIFAKRETLLKTKQATPPTEDLKSITTLVFGVGAAVVNGNPKLEIRYRGGEANTTDLLAKLIVSKLDLALQKPVTAPLDLGAVVDMAAGAGLVKVGLAANASLTLVAVRLDFAPGMTAAAWSEFFTGNIADTLGGLEWSALIDKGLIEAMIEGIASDILAGVSDFKLSSGPTASWEPTGSGTAAVTLKFSGEAVDACQCFWGEIDVDVDVTMDLTIRLKEPQVLPNTGEKVLQVHASIDTEKSFWESACCVLSAALMWPYVGNKFVAGKLPWYLNLLRMFAGIGNLIDAIGMATIGGADGPLENLPEDAAKKLSDDEFIYEMRVPLGDFGFGKLTAEEAAGAPNGLVLRGSIAVTEKTMPVAQVAWPVKFAWRGPCGGGLSLRATVWVSNKGQLPLEICSVEKLNAPNDFFVKLPAWSQVGVGSPVELEVTAWKVGPLDGLSTACELLIRTTGGARFLSIPSVAPMTEQEWTTFKANRDALCKSNAKTIWAGFPFPIPEPDPAIDPTLKVVHAVHALIGGLEPGELVRAHFGENPLATAAALPDGSAQLSAFLEQPELGGRLALSRAGAPVPDDEFEKKPRQIIVQHTMFEVVGNIRLRSAVTHLSIGQLGGASVLLVSTAADLRAYDIGRAAVLQLQLLAAASRLRGAMPWRGAVLGWGEEGLLWFGDSGVLIGSRGEGRLPVTDVIQYRDCVYALTASSVVVYRAAGLRHRGETAVIPAPVELERVGAVRAEGAQAMVLAGGRLVLGGERGLTLYDLTEPAVPKRVADYPMEDTLDLRRAPLVSGGKMVFVGRRRGGSVYELAGREAREIVHFEQDPWFARAVWSHSTLARLDSRRTQLTVYRVARTTEIGGLAGNRS